MSILLTSLELSLLRLEVEMEHRRFLELADSSRSSNVRKEADVDSLNLASTKAPVTRIVQDE